MATLIVLGLIFILIWFLVSEYQKGSSRSDSGRTRSRSGASSADYDLAWNEYGGGEGYTVVRTSDGQKLSWRTLPRSKGLESLPVSGESHHMDDLQSPTFAPGERITLVPEPDNPYDQNAIAIMDADGKHQAGYVPGGEAERIGRKLESGKIEQAYSMWQVMKRGRRVSLRVLLVGPGVSVQG